MIGTEYPTERELEMARGVERSPGKASRSNKSALTRERIVIATIDCIIEHGYDKTTMAKVAKRAHLSLGAMQYHFDSKIDTIKAAISFLNEKRLADRTRDLAHMPAGVNPLAHGIEIYWKHLNEDHFLAYQELVIAARTDPELAAVLRPAYRKFLRTHRAGSMDQVPEWKQNAAQFDLVADMIQHLMEGLAFGRLNHQIDARRTRNVIDFASELIVSWVEDHFSGVRTRERSAPGSSGADAGKRRASK